MSDEKNEAATGAEQPGKDTRYNGWANYETWAVNLWIENEEPTYDEARDMTREALDENEDEDTATYILSKRIKEWVADMTPDLGASLAGDLLGAALSEVRWYEIAEAWVREEVAERKRDADA